MFSSLGLMYVYILGSNQGTNNFAFEVKVTLRLENICPDVKVDETGSKGAPWIIGLR